MEPGESRLWDAMWILIIVAHAPIAAYPLHDAVCVASGEEQTQVLECSDDKQIQIITVYVGKTPSWRASFYNCEDPVVLSIDWQQLDKNLTEAVRGMCNSLGSCQAQVFYPSEDPAPKIYNSGITFINVEYECRTVLKWGGGEPVVMHPMVGGQISFLGQQLILQSPDYPSMVPLTANTQCRLEFPQRNKVRLDVYDLSYEGVYVTVPYCVRWPASLRCPLQAATFQPDFFEENTTILFDIMTDAAFNGRFWMILTTHTAGGLQGYGSFNVTCIEYVPTSPPPPIGTTNTTTNDTDTGATTPSHANTSYPSSNDDILPLLTTNSSPTLLTTSVVNPSSSPKTTTSRSTSKFQFTSSSMDIYTTLRSGYDAFTTPTLAGSTHRSNQGTSFLTHPAYMSSEQTSAGYTVTATTLRSAYTPSDSWTDRDDGSFTTPFFTDSNPGSARKTSGMNGVVIGSLSAVIFVVVVIASVLAIFLYNKRRKLSKVKVKAVQKRKRRARGRRSVPSPRHSNNYEESKIVLEPLPPVRYDEYTEIHEMPGVNEPAHTVRMFYKDAPPRTESNTLYVNQHVADNHNDSRQAPPPPKPRSRTLPAGRQLTILNNLNLINGRSHAKVPTSSTSSGIAIIENMTHT